MPLIELADAAHQVHTGGVRHAQIEYDQIKIVEVGPHVGEQLRHALGDHRSVPRCIERRLKAIAHERRIGGYQNRLASNRRRRHNARMTRAVRCRLYQVLVIIWTDRSPFAAKEPPACPRFVPSAIHPLMSMSTTSTSVMS